MRINIETLGCKLNQAETGALARRFTAAGHQVVGRGEPADIYILNTCTVTGTADAKARHLLRLARRRNPGALVVATGCYADRAPLDLAKMGEVDIVTGNDGKSGLPERLVEEGVLKGSLLSPPWERTKVRGYNDDGETASPSAEGGHLSSPLTGEVRDPDANRGNGVRVTGGIPASEIAGRSSLTPLPTPHRTRAFIKVQDGCRNYCAYCIVPYVRRQETSVSPDDIVNEIRQRVAEGCQEAVLTGTRIGGYDSGGLKLTGLAQRIMKETGIARLRLSSLQPGELSPALLALWRDKRLCPHFHLSLQSGSDSVLKRMRRRYTTSEYSLAVALIRASVPDVAITTDVIVGFPGETDAEFQESLVYCRNAGFARIHIFPFSPRSGTEAAGMPGQVPEMVKKERARILLELAAESARTFREQFTGATLDVLWEQERDTGVWSGVTGNYIRVQRKDKRNLTNKLGKVNMS